MSDAITLQSSSEIVQSRSFYFNFLPSPVTYCLPQVLSMYLSCSGYTEVTNSCLDRVVCEYANENNKISQEERDVISM